MMILPMTSDGTRRVTVNVGSGIYIFRTYFIGGPSPRWLLDIMDETGKDMLVGMPIFPGLGNLLKGQGDKFKGAGLRALLKRGGKANDPEALGNTLDLLWMDEDEVSLFPSYDPMVD